MLPFGCWSLICLAVWEEDWNGPRVRSKRLEFDPVPKSKPRPPHANTPLNYPPPHHHHSNAMLNSKPILPVHVRAWPGDRRTRPRRRRTPEFVGSGEIGDGDEERGIGGAKVEEVVVMLS
ncbi:hypothetical protein Droror1_Dr00020795 [Drosera rotundifolia]